MANGVKKEEQEYAALIGLDWADQRHVVSITDTASGKKSTATVEHTPVALQEWVNRLREKYPGRKVALALEQSRGPVVYALMDYEIFDIYPINPVAMSSFRKTLATSGAKDDPTDAELIRMLLEKHRDRLRRLVLDDALTRKIRLLCEKRRKIVDIRTSLSNRLIAVLKEYYPQALTLIGRNTGGMMSCEFLNKWPTLEDLQRAREETIKRFYYQHKCRSNKRIQERLKLIREERPLTQDEPIMEASKMMALALCKQLRQLNASVLQFDKAIEKAFLDHEDRRIFRRFPGAGGCLAPRLMSIFGTDRDRWEDAADVQKFSGIAPVISRSGKSLWIHKCYACPIFIRQSFQEFAGASIKYSVWSRAYYDQQRAHGAGHQAALRSLAFKWIRIIFRCWKNRQEYDEVKYLQALKKAGSDVLNYIGAKPVHVPAGG